MEIEQYVLKQPMGQKEIIKEVIKYIEMNKNKSIRYQNLYTLIND